MRHPLPSDLLPKVRHPTVRRTAEGIHAFDTEVRSLEQACDLIEARNRYKKIAEKAKNRPQTLRQEFGLAKGRARLLKNLGKITLAGGETNKPDSRFTRKARKNPHPLKDLSAEQKQAKVKEFYEGGFWGIGLPAKRRLAQAFGVPVGQISVWLDG